MKRIAVVLIATLAGCGATETRGVAPVGTGPQFRPAAGAERPCVDRPRTSYVHVELFAHGKVMIVPAGIGVRDGRRDGAYVRGGCRAALFTTEPTGLVAVTRPGLTLGDLFDTWGEPITRTRLTSFAEAVRVHVDGRPWPGHPRDVPLEHHAQIVIQAGGPPVDPHASYTFPR